MRGIHISEAGSEKIFEAFGNNRGIPLDSNVNGF